MSIKKHMELQPKKVSNKDWELRIEQIFDLLKVKDSAIYMVIEDDKGIRPINKTEFDFLQNDKLIKIANKYNIGYNGYNQFLMDFGEDPENQHPYILMRKLKLGYIIEIVDNIIDDSLHVSENELKHFLGVFRKQVISYTDDIFYDSLIKLPIYKEDNVNYIKGSDE